MKNLTDKEKVKVLVIALLKLDPELLIVKPPLGQKPIWIETLKKEGGKVIYK
jgi:hypothetical protein